MARAASVSDRLSRMSEYISFLLNLYKGCPDNRKHELRPGFIGEKRDSDTGQPTDCPEVKCANLLGKSFVVQMSAEITDKNWKLDHESNFVNEYGDKID